MITEHLKKSEQSYSFKLYKKNLISEYTRAAGNKRQPEKLHLRSVTCDSLTSLFLVQEVVQETEEQVSHSTL